MSISAKVICDSISPQGVRLTTLELCYHRFIHSEVMTHRMFSRNASSSRAIPIEKMIKQVEENPAMPIHWGKNQPGMQAREEISGFVDRFYESEDDFEYPIEAKRAAKLEWECLAAQAADEARDLNNDFGLHKQIINRVLEPFQWIKVIVTATEWDNFFKLRLHLDAQPEIQELARCMKKAMEESTPVELNPGEWHLPFLTEDERSITNSDECLEDAIKWSIARCARVSYLNHDNSNPDIEKDIALADKLLEARHMSPFEHQATPMQEIDTGEEVFLPNLEIGVTHVDINQDLWSSNFRGWIQYRNVL